MATVVLLALALLLPSPASAPRTHTASASRPADPPVAPAAAEVVAVAPAQPQPAEPAPAVAEQVAPPAPVASAPAAPHTVMLIGDSMAYTASLGLAPHAGAWDFALANEGIMGCGVVRGGPYRYFGAQHDMEARCDAWPAAWQDALARNHPDLVAIVVGRWELMDRMHDGRWTNVFDPTFAAYLSSEIDNALTLALSGGARVALFTTPYYRRGTTADGGLFPEDDPARVDLVNGILRAAALRRGVPVIDVGGWLSPEGKYTAEVNGVKVRSDGVHLTRQTGDLLAPWLFPQFQAAMSPASS